MQIDALVIAGGYNNDKLQKCSEVAKEALIPIGDKVMVEYVVNALEHTPGINKIVVVGPIELKNIFADKKHLLVAEEGKTAIDSVINGLELLKPQGRLLILTADIPLINPTAITGFLEACQEKDIDIYYPIVPKEVNEAKYPGIERTYVTIKDGTFTGGNAFFVNPKIVKKCAEKGKKLVKLRKSPLALSSLIGWTFILKLVSKRLTLKEAEEKFSGLLDVKARAVISPYPEIGIDVDKPSDLQLVKKVILGVL
ncbi:MAG: hypothetical protein APF76_15595 [Desulfitibacter sp. BRH_c19]|nr:MAG: hypothetical protein APF76_15595 [Desulfitibacter sp. BRH_c19]